MNASDKAQIKKQEKEFQKIRKQELADLKYVLASEQGRRLVWRLMGKCKTFSSIWETSAKIHYNAGQQDLGHFLLAEVMEANSESFLQMMKENKENA